METDGKLMPELKKKKKEKDKNSKMACASVIHSMASFNLLYFYHKATLTLLSKLKTTKRV